MQLDEYPRYRLARAFYAEDDTLWPEGAELTYDGCPNMDMEPLNEPARIRMTEFIRANQPVRRDLGDMVHDAVKAVHERDRVAAEVMAGLVPGPVAGVAETPIEFPKYDTTIPQVPNHILPGQRKRGRPRKVMIEGKIPEVTGKPLPKQRIMGTVIRETPGGIDTGGGLNT